MSEKTITFEKILLKVRACRNENHVSFLEFLGVKVHPSSYSRWESGEFFPNDKHLFFIVENIKKYIAEAKVQILSEKEIQFLEELLP